MWDRKINNKFPLILSDSAKQNCIEGEWKFTRCEQEKSFHPQLRPWLYMQWFIIGSMVLLLVSSCAKKKPASQVDTTTRATQYVENYLNNYTLVAGMQSLGPIVNHVKPSVVGIGILTSTANGTRFSNLGSGVIVDIRGYVLCAADIVTGNDQPKITLFKNNEGHQFDGNVLATDPGQNLALLAIQSQQGTVFPFTPLRSQIMPKVGYTVVALLSEDGLNLKTVPGIVSAVRRSEKIGGRAYENLIQTDIRKNMDNGGCPVFDMQGGIVGLYLGKGLVLPVSQSSPIFTYAMNW